MLSLNVEGLAEILGPGPQTSSDKLRKLLAYARQQARVHRPTSAKEALILTGLKPMLGFLSVPDNPQEADDFLTAAAQLLIALRSDLPPLPAAAAATTAEESPHAEVA